MSLKEDFERAAKDVQGLKARPRDEDLLALYALYKQALEGDAKGSRPGIFDIKARKKFDTWVGKKGMSPDQAISAYIALVNQLKTR